jgi:hypothetical protein
MVPSSQDIFSERILIQRLKRACEESFSVFVQKTKPGLLLKISKDLTVNIQALALGNFCRFYD